MSLGCIKLKNGFRRRFVNATTINGAYAMGISETHGSFEGATVANIFITKTNPYLEYDALCVTPPTGLKRFFSTVTLLM